MSITLDGSTGISVSGNNNLSIGTLAAGNTTITGTLAANATTITGNVSVTGTQFVNGVVTFANSTGNTVFVAANGQVGINTNSPSKLSGVKSLTIDSTGSNYSGVELSVANTKTFDLLASNSASYISTRTNTPIIFQTNDADKGRITGAGDVLINTANNTAGGFNSKLHVKQSNNYWYGGITVVSAANDHAVTLGCDNASVSLTSSYIALSGYRPLILRAGGYEAVNIDTSGRVQMPYQICVQCGAPSTTYNTGSTNQHWGQSGYVFQNQGSGWNASTGIFTSPISATYMVIVKVRFSTENYSSTGNYNYLQLANSNGTVNGQPLLLWSPASFAGGTYRPYMLTAIMKLNTNDTITPRLIIQGGGSVTTDGGSTGQTDDQLSIIQIG